MFKKRDILIVLIAATLLSACKKIDDPTPTDSDGLTISGNVMTPDQTKYAGGSVFAKGDQISLYALERKSDSEVPILKPAGNHFNNALFQLGDYYFEHQDKGEGKLGFPTNGAMMDLYAVYPYHATIPTNLPNIELQLEADQTTETKMLTNDFLRAAKLQVKPQLQPVNLEFYHAMAKFVVMVSRAEKYETDNITVEEIRIKQLITKSIYNIQDATADIEATPARVDILPLVSTTPLDGKNLPTRTMIVAPQELPIDQVVVEIVMSNKKLHTFGFDNNSTLENRNLASGSLTTLNILVSPGATQAVVLNNTMKDWNTGEIINQTVQQQNANEFICYQATSADAKWVKATVEVGTSKTKHTFELPVTYEGGTNPAWKFGFPGVGNRPNTYPYTVTNLAFFDASGVAIGGNNAINVGNVVGEEGQNLVFTLGTIDDSRNSPANCYVAYGTSKMIIFNALKKPVAKFAAGNSAPVNAKGANPSTADVGLENDIVYQKGDKLEVAWQTAVGHGTAGGADNMVVASATLDGTGAASVMTRGAGNAVLSYKRAGVTLWNYHIWVTDTDPFKTFYATGGNVNGTAEGGAQAKFMDRNLGALSSTTTKPTAAADAYKYFGVLYQHGRPTPFSGQGAGTTINTYTAIFDGAGAVISAGTIGGYTPSNTAVSSVTAAIQTPNTYYYWLHTSSGNWTWYQFGDISLWSDYGTNKSIYDPCPYGYRVPKSGEGTSSSWYGFPSTKWTNGDITGGATWSSTWWPASGLRWGDSDKGALATVGNLGYYWSSTRYSDAYYSYFLDFNYGGSVNPSSNNLRSNGFTVRCVQEGY